MYRDRPVDQNVIDNHEHRIETCEQEGKHNSDMIFRDRAEIRRIDATLTVALTLMAIIAVVLAVFVSTVLAR